MYDATHLEALRSEASDVYFKLVARLGDDKAIAKKIAPLYKTNVFAIKKYIESFSFRNEKNVKRFVETGNQILNELDECPINAKALLLCAEDESELRIKERARHLIALGIHAIVPQLLLGVNDKQFWDFVLQDAKYANFIIAPKSMLEPRNKIANKAINKIADMYNLQVIDNEQDDDIKAHAIQISIKLLSEEEKQIKKRRQYE